MAILPDFTNPRVTSLRSAPGARATERLDALLVVAPLGVASAAFDRLPEAARWRALHARAPAKAGSVRTTTLANARQTLAVLGYAAEGATPFEHLNLAGRMLKEAAGRASERIALTSVSGAAAAAPQTEALLAASLAQAFALPNFQSARPRKPRRITDIALVEGRGAAPDLRYAQASARGTNLARWLTALPANRLDARSYRGAIAELARARGLSMRWIGEPALRRLGAGAFLAVSAGNATRTAGIAHLRYRPPRRRSTRVDLALIGKGILFDTGGNNLKAHRGMLDMHIDMSGSAVALATLLALAELRAPIAADCWLAITENRIGPTAYRPQDVVRAANGVTIQVIHTDAEGRMVLADTLALAGRTRPRFMLDFATLTGACLYALTERMSGVFTNTPHLAPLLVAAGETSGERVWNFPMDQDYDTDLESRSADIVQCAGDGKGDHILAARFLRRFVPAGTPWVHVDLASALRSGGLGHVTSDITGFGVRFALELLLRKRVLDELGHGS